MVHKDLTVEETIAAVRRAEEGILRVEQRCYKVMKTNMMLPSAHGYMIRMEMAKENDQEFLNTGIDGSDLMPSVARHNLKENKEYLNMLEEMKKKSDDYFDLLNDDVTDQLRKAKDDRIT